VAQLGAGVVDYTDQLINRFEYPTYQYNSLISSDGRSQQMEEQEIYRVGRLVVFFKYKPIEKRT